MLLEKIAEWAFAYCFGILEIYAAFAQRTHAVIAIGLPMVVVVGVHAVAPRWGDLLLAGMIVGPAAAAAITMVIHALVLMKQR